MGIAQIALDPPPPPSVKQATPEKSALTPAGNVGKSAPESRPSWQAIIPPLRAMPIWR